jgi:hypothetical protein
MRQRCYNPKNPAYPQYGGRGITICDRWSDFNLFVEDMYPGYKPNLSVDRIDNNGNYSPENCRWATSKEQANNRNNARLFVFDGTEGTLTFWAEKIGVKRSTLAQRFYSYGWPIQRVLSTK